MLITIAHPLHGIPHRMIVLTEAREKIAQAAIIAEENNIEFRPLGDIFSSAEIESQGWSSSNC